MNIRVISKIVMHFPAKRQERNGQNLLKPTSRYCTLKLRSFSNFIFDFNRQLSSKNVEKFNMIFEVARGRIFNGGQ